MVFTFLGTGTSQGVPMIGCNCVVCTSADTRDKRLRTSLMIEDRSKRVVIDAGPDFRQQMLRENIRSLDGIIFTHEHKDHIAGLDDVRAFNYLNKMPMEVYATSAVQEALRREFFYVFTNTKYPGIPKINLNTIDSSVFEVEGIKITPVPVMHLELPVMGFRIADFSYVTDANFISDSSKEILRNSKVLVLNALRRDGHPSHFTLSEALRIIEDLKPGKAFLTHMSHQMGLHEKVIKELPENVSLAFDGLKVHL